MLTGPPMTTLKELLGAEPKRGAVVQDCCEVLDQEVADKSGLGGIAIKGAYGVVKSVKPGFVREVVNALLDDFLDAMDPLYQEALSSGTAPGAHLNANRGRVATALLAVTDAKAERAQRPAIKKAYLKLRPTAEKHVEAAAPRLAGLFDRHLAS